ncbi:hypothetical protein EV356DRAFT_196874 [Viridothelium virens]|uniref:Uncharacterized protein n=1 Tax=Viridothelium virens TaxID=1048519 RepID=A0A6A6H7I8_VIRVR|nr:hypothetical protein EV356DRAFT_196874 [Viridothelium virens]
MAPTRPNLKITPTPFQPSRLGIPPSPFSPLSPLTPPPRPSQKSHLDFTKPRTHEHTFPPPGKPLQWLWKCHICNHVYPLGATRRCLEDGHRFCSGTTVTRSRRTNGKSKFKRHKPCTSEFDYQGWKRWSAWRREQTGYTITRSGTSTPDSAIAMSPSRSSRSHKDCWNRCDYPSECRWGTESTTASQSSTPVISPQRSSTPTTSPPVSQVTFDTILGHDESNQENDVAPSSQSPTRNALSTEFWQSILSATRGRRATSSGRFEPSPLRLHPIQEDDCGSSNDEATSSAITPDSYLTDEAEEEEEDEAEDAFVDAMDLVIEDGVAEGEYQMPAIPLRRLAPLEEEMDWDEEEVGEKVGVPARCEDVELDLDLNLDPRLRNGGSDWR